MITLEILDNPNCPSVDLRVFHDLEPPQPAVQVKLAREGQASEWYDVTGWSQAGSPCPAWVQKVDDSGEGVAYLIHGGDAGLRLQPSERPSPWRIDDPRQWGEPLLILPAAEDVITEPAHG